MTIKTATTCFIFFNFAHKRKESIVPETCVERWTCVKKHTKLIESLSNEHTT